MEQWFAMGVDGLNIQGTQFLFEGPIHKDEPVNDNYNGEAEVRGTLVYGILCVTRFDNSTLYIHAKPLINQYYAQVGLDCTATKPYITLFHQLMESYERCTVLSDVMFPSTMDTTD